MTPVELVLSKLPDARRSGKGWNSRCPAHDDRRASMSITEGDDGRALLHCHAGCTPEAICGAIDLKPAELFGDRSTGSTFDGNRPKPAKRTNTVAAGKTKPSGRTFATSTEAIAELERSLGPRSAEWIYHDAEAIPVCVVVRWDRTEGKEIRPVSLGGDGWRIGGMPEPRPLYALPEVLKAETIYVCEGEKAADAVRSLGLTATTSAHGSQSAEKTDWQPLAGKSVVILPDNDPAGGIYADTVAAILGKLGPTTIKILELPGLPDKGDAVEWVAARDPQTMEAIRAELERLVDEAESIVAEEPPEKSRRFKPFPVDALPWPIGGFVKRMAEAIGCDPSFIVLPLLAALGAAIGNTRRLLVKGTWEVPPIVWTAIVAHSGAAKSPAIDIARRPVEERQRKALKRYEIEREAFAAESVEYDRELRNYQNGKRDDMPERPTEPIADRYWCDDVTMEAVAARLRLQPRGFILIRDELAGWFGGFDRYSSGKGGDAPRWLECFGGRTMLVDRKSGELIHIERAAVCVTGSIQPATLKLHLSETYRQNGLAARMLFAYPPRRTKRWNDTAIDQIDLTKLATIFDRLYGLEFGTNAEGDAEPILVRLDDGARARFVAFYDEHNREQADLTDDLSAAWSKLEEYPARLALIVHFVRWAVSDPSLADPMTIDAASMEAGIVLSRWFANEARRIYAMLDESDDDAERRKLAEWIAAKGGRVTPRMLQQGKRGSKAAEAEAKLQELIEHGFGRWENSPAGRRGQPTRWFALFGFNGNRETPEENPNTVDVETVDDAEESGPWGEI